MHKQFKEAESQRGFSLVEIILGVVVVVLIGGLITWRVYDAQQRARINEQNTTNQGQPQSINKTSGESPKEPTSNGPESTSPQASSLPANPTPPSSSAQAHNQPSTSPITTPSAPVNNSTPAAAPQPPSNITRPTAEFCAQKDGSSFTNVWFTDNQTYTYQVWENGSLVSKTKTGTPVRNYDSMNIVDVLPHLSTPAWAMCSKPGYIMVYYKVAGSPYTFNSLVAFGHVSLTQP